MMTSVLSSDDGVANKMIGHAIRTPDLIPSPQPAQLSLRHHANGNGHKILGSGAVGYIAPKFEGKEAQINEGG